MFVGLAQYHFVVLVEAIGDFPVAVVAEACCYPAALRMAGDRQCDKLSFPFAVDRADRQG